jgi:diguanylate cyclase (GGDEF)-like protein/PAS domain S-box-containing protein
MASAKTISIRLWVTAPVTAVVCLAVVAALIGVDRFAGGFAERKSLEALRGMATDLRDRIDRGMEQNLDSLKLISQLNDDCTSGSPDPVRRCLTRARESFPHFTWLGWVDPRGTVVAASAGMFEGHEVSEQAWFRAGQERPFASDVRVVAGGLSDKSDAARRRVIDLALPITDASGRTTGVLAAQLGWEWVRDLAGTAFDPSRFEHGAVEILLLDKSHRPLLGSHAEGSEADYLSAKASTRGRGRYEGSGWIVVVRQLREQASRDHVSARTTWLVGGVALLAIAIAVTLWFAGRLASPLRAAAMQLAKSRLVADADLSTPQRHVELDALLGALSGLQARQAQHDQHSSQRLHDLEDKLSETSGNLLNLNAGLRNAMERLAAAQRQSEENEHKLRTITDNLPVLILYIDSTLRVQFCNATLEQWIAHEPDRVLGLPLANTAITSLFGEHAESLQRVLAGERAMFDVQCRIQGQRRDLHTICLPDRRDGAVVGMFALCTDVTAMKQLTRDLERLSRVDVLTGLPNRRQLDERFPETIARARRSGRQLAVCFMDIDKFKSINDTWGHAAGDQVIRAFGSRSAAAVRETDFVARLAGDEFVALLEDLQSPEEATLIAKKIAASVAQPIMVDDRELSISASIGIALYRDGEATLASLLCTADNALYEAKAAGRNCIRVASAVSDA